MLQCYLINNDCYKAGLLIKPVGIVLHSTGANNKSLKRYVQPAPTQATYLGGKTRHELLQIIGTNSYNNHWNKGNTRKCVHAFVGAAANNSVTAVQTLPWNMRAWGVGNGRNGSYNNTHIQIEICEDALVDKSYFDAAFNKAAELCGTLCSKYDLPVDAIVSHAEAHRRGYASNHSDPEHWFKRFGKSMNDFRTAVAQRVSNKQVKAYLVRVAADTLNVRKGPSIAHAVTTTVKKNEVYTIVDEQNGWGKLKSGSGWVNLKYTTKV